MRKDRGKLRTGKSRKTRVSMFSTETRQRKRPLWKGDDTLCADGRSCEFFLMCWMTAGLLDGSCGGIMYACCQRKDPKALVDNNLIESPRDQSRPLPLDLYTETASDDRKSSLRQACPPSMSCGTVHLHEHESSPSVFLSPLFSLSLSLSLSLYFSSLFYLHHSRALACTVPSFPSSHVVSHFSKKLEKDIPRLSSFSKKSRFVLSPSSRCTTSLVSLFLFLDSHLTHVQACRMSLCRSLPSCACLCSAIILVDVYRNSSRFRMIS